MWNTIILYLILYITYLNFGAGLFLFLDYYRQLDVQEVPPINATENFKNMLDLLIKKGFTEAQVQEAVNNWDDLLEFKFIDEDVLVGNTVWSFFNGFLFAFHLCSTIGYGNLSPVTMHGQLLAIAYGIIGISIHRICFNLLGDSYSEKHGKTMMWIQGDDTESKRRKIMSHLVFFAPWMLILWFIPSIVFMFTEKWTFLEGLYYTFITLTTVGLGDYVAGKLVARGYPYLMYKICLFIWMFYGLAFTAMAIDCIFQFYKRHLLYILKIDWRKRNFKMLRVHIDIERLDMHFKLLKKDTMKARFSLYAVRRSSGEHASFKEKHLAHIIALVNSLQAKMSLMIEREKEEKDVQQTSLPEETKKVHFRNETSKMN